MSQFLEMCPALVYQLDQKVCQIDSDYTGRYMMYSSTDNVTSLDSFLRSPWAGSSIAVGVISVAGFLVVATIPIVAKLTIFHHLIQFLISLAIGTLTADALMHLLPHAMVPHTHQHISLKRRGGVANLGNTSSFVGTNLPIDDIENKHPMWIGVTTFAAILFFFVLERVLKMTSDFKEKRLRNKISHEVIAISALKTPPVNNNDVIVGQETPLVEVHSGGASFISGLSVGLSTAVAIFCHEIPHELGDFAVLLKSGMTMKQALFCNFLSSVLCFLGMICGVLIGNQPSVTLWIYGVTAGIFIYIALVDMLPQVTSQYEMESAPNKLQLTNITVDKNTKSKFSFGKMRNLKRLILHVTGILMGFTIMLLIALYEDQISII
ncbi:hypothetical protein HELRODRAFT_190614 [Helobdella robusta]|uniref:Uncharacterized protein n=1 Tax=Helobdella robusta TaxID=6412 RepID=T1FS50_HELRO|nr:hypothetical protein HELRODRAFT_190614 [Helobdella robusta]ESO08805.1 hypothetical protein HELRODRAFT_190614 [Helobdella robusta]